MKTLFYLLAIILISPMLIAAENPSSTVSVRGMVNMPGKIEISAPTALATVLEKAGGIHMLWDRSIRVVRQESKILTVTYVYRLGSLSQAEKEKTLREVMIQPGDDIYIPDIE